MPLNNEEPYNQKMSRTTLTIDEFKTWFGFTLNLSMETVQEPSLRDFWDQSTLTKTHSIAAVD